MGRGRKSPLSHPVLWSGSRSAGARVEEQTVEERVLPRPRALLPKSASTTVRPRSRGSTSGPSAFKPQRQPRVPRSLPGSCARLVQSCGHPPSGVWLQPGDQGNHVPLRTQGNGGEVYLPLPVPISRSRLHSRLRPRPLTLTLYSFPSATPPPQVQVSAPPSPSVWPQQPLNVPIGSPALYLVISAQKHGLTTVTIMSAVPEFMGPRSKFNLYDPLAAACQTGKGQSPPGQS